MPSDESLRHQIALGWVIELLLVVLMLVVMIVDSVLMDNNFFSLRMDPGGSLSGWMVFLLGGYALMPVYVHLVHPLAWRGGRWLAVALSAAGFLFFLLHHLAHWQAGQRPTLSSHALDLTLHLVSIWVLATSIRWARRPAAPEGTA
jgi:hypothetical protein